MKSILNSFCILLFLGLTACQVPGLASTQKSGASTDIPGELPPAYTPSPVILSTPTKTKCQDLNGVVKKANISTDLLSNPVNVNIYLPPCYDSNLDETYPVLYMLHGQAASNDQWIDLGITTTADGLTSSMLIQPMIIVMPYEISWRVGPDISKYGDALIDDVIPYIENHYRVCVRRSCRAIGGLSRGGNWAVNLGFSHPEVFAAVGAHSAPLFYGEIGRIEAKLGKMTAEVKLPALYIDTGKKDEQKDQILEFVDFLMEEGISYEFHQNEGRHEAAYWTAHLADYLKWYSSQFEISR